MTNEPQASGDLLTESLRLLAVAHYVLAFVTALLTPAGVYLAYVGWSLLHPARGEAWTPEAGQELFDPLRWGAAYFLIGGILASLALLHAGVLVFVGRAIAGRRRRVFCLMFSAFDLTYIPLGTALGVFTLMLLTKPQVKQQFD
jgi:hypothetical protein